MSVEIKVNGEVVYCDCKRDKYFPYQGDDSFRESVDDDRRNIFSNSLIENTKLEAVFSGSRGAFLREESDVDNILLYNMGIASKMFKSFTLEKIIKAGKQPIRYDYKNGNQDTEEGIFNSEYIIDTDEIPLENNLRGVNSFYTIFRSWVLDNRNQLRTIEDNTPLELAIEYRYEGTNSVSENSFIKPAIDGIISALQREQEESEPSTRDFCILEGERAKHRSRNGRWIWSPMDDLVKKIVVNINNSGNKNYIRIGIKKYKPKG